MSMTKVVIFYAVLLAFLLVCARVLSTLPGST